ncbi:MULTISPECIES: hypothetical protein [Pseudomonas fluorescens group]|uniref:Glycosyl hydrolase-like 10 domain-containing protein n=1 Tax=Pseudomonas fluorescens TaxID=294 RepID=A0A0D0RVL0_PSEFL|nr:MULTISPECIES: hypothetical protein [Pseudomonas fluorescens group]AZE62695.1 hypothetical protein C4K02_4350 [Pseudomonas synxantha]KIR23617.1 hypothetical protein PFLU3_09680 [Pseudomonas fluorescens]
MNQIKTFIFILTLLITSTPFAAGQPAKNYIYFPNRGADGSNIRADKVLSDPRFSGAQIVYTWRNLEPVKDQYDFSAIKEDLAYLSSIDKKLWIQLQEKSFQPNLKNVPDYLLLDPIYKGGVLKQSMLSAPERDPNKPETDDEYGWSAKMWEKPVRDRFQKLIAALGKELDGKIEGINLSESSIEIGVEQPDGTTAFPSDFDPKVYVDAINSNMQALSRAFRKSTPMVYLNFLPGEWLPWQDKGYMRSLFAEAKQLKMGVGGPDLMPYRKSHLAQTYGFFKAYPDTLVKGMAVQDGNLRQINPKTGKKNTVADIIDFSRNYLGLDYIFWVEYEPYFTNEVMQQLPH